MGNIWGHRNASRNMILFQGRITLNYHADDFTSISINRHKYAFLKLYNDHTLNPFCLHYWLIMLDVKVQDSVLGRVERVEKIICGHYVTSRHIQDIK